MSLRTHAAAALSCLPFLFPAATAQVTTATFYGIVTDPSAAAIVGARVTLAHEGTGATSTTATDQIGEFTFLPVGLYRLRIEAAGFRTYESSGVELLAAQSVRRSFTLEVGGVAEVVEVKA